MKLAVLFSSLLAVGLAGCLEGQPRHHVSPAEEKALPINEFALGESLCPANYVPSHLATKWRREAVAEYKALRIALRRRPDYFVTARYALSDPEGDEDRNQTEELTVFQLAQTHIEPIANGDPVADDAVEGSGPMQCRRSMRATLVRLMGGPERAEPQTSGQIAHVP